MTTTPAELIAEDGWREHLEMLRDDLLYGAINLREDTLSRPDANTDLHCRIADERERWAHDIHSAFAEIDRLAAALEAAQAPALSPAMLLAMCADEPNDHPAPWKIASDGHNEHWIEAANGKVVGFITGRQDERLTDVWPALIEAFNAAAQPTQGSGDYVLAGMSEAEAAALLERIRGLVDGRYTGLTKLGSVYNIRAMISAATPADGE